MELEIPGTASVHWIGSIIFYPTSVPTWYFFRNLEVDNLLYIKKDSSSNDSITTVFPRIRLYLNSYLYGSKYHPAHPNHSCLSPSPPCEFGLRCSRAQACPRSILKRSSTVTNPGDRHVRFSDETEVIGSSTAVTRTRKRDKIKELGKAILQGLSRLKKQRDKRA